MILQSQDGAVLVAEPLSNQSHRAGGLRKSLGASQTLACISVLGRAGEKHAPGLQPGFPGLGQGREGVELRICISNKLLDAADAALPGPALTLCSFDLSISIT